MKKEQLRNDRDIEKQLAKEQDTGITATVLKLPCGHADIEIDRAEDQVVKCPVCLKRSFLVWSTIGRHKIDT